MPTTRKRKSRSVKSLKLWEKAFLTNDDSGIEPGSRAEVRLKIMRDDLDRKLMFGDRTGRELLEAFPEYKR